MGAWARYLFERWVGKRGPFMSGRWVGAVPLRAVDEWARSLYERWVGGRGPSFSGGWVGAALYRRLVVGWVDPSSTVLTVVILVLF